MKEDPASRLLKLKELIQSASQKVSEAKGAKDALMKEMKETFGCKSSKEAEKMLEEYRTEIEELETAIDRDLSFLEEKVNELR